MRVFKPKTKEECITEMAKASKLIKMLERMKEAYYAEGRRVRKLIDEVHNIRTHYAHNLFIMNKDDKIKKK